MLPLRVPVPLPSAGGHRPEVRPQIDRGAWLLFFAQGLSGLGAGPFVAFGAIYQRQLGASAFEIGLLAAIAMVVATVVMLPGTRLAESRSLRKTIIAGWIIAIPAPLFFAVAPHWAWTAVGMVFLQASVVNAPAISVYLTLGVPRDRIAMVMTTVMSAYSIGLIASSLLTGWLAQVAPLFALFWVSFAFYCLAAVCITFLPHKEQPRASTTPTRYADLLRYPAYMMLLGLFTLVTLIIFLPWTFTALYARDFGRVDNFWIGILIGVLYLGSVLLGVALAGLRRALGSVAIVLLFEAAYVISAVLLFSSRALPVLVAAFFLRGAFWSFRHVMTAVVGEVLPDAAMAKGYGLFALITGAGAALAYPIGGLMYGMEAGMPFWSSAVLMGAAMVGTVMVRSYFHANYLKPVEAEIPVDKQGDAALPQAA